MTEERSVVHGCTPGMDISEKYRPSPPALRTGEDTILFFSGGFAAGLTGDSHRIVPCKVRDYESPILTLEVLENGECRGLWIRDGQTSRLVDTDGNPQPNLEALLNG